MTETDFPLLELFNRLRQSNIPLGMDEYFLALKALEGGFGLQDWGALQRLCRALWVKDNEDEIIFRAHFHALLKETVVQTPKPEMPPTIDIFTPPPATDATVPVEDDKQKAPPTVVDQVSSETNKMPPMSGLAWAVDDELVTAQTAFDETMLATSRFRFGRDYLPVSHRQMKQAWRYLRQPVRDGPAVELDIEATIARAAAEGVLLDLILRPRRINRAELVLLIDQGGSMIPFHALSRRLVDTAVRGGRLGAAGVYYFSNIAHGYLYQDAYFVTAKALPDFFNNLHSTRTTVLIFSDAGAARGYYNQTRIDRTQVFLSQLQQTVQHIAWLNPMPPQRWPHNSAEAISRMLPMFPLTRSGLHSAINVLRGRHAASTGGQTA